MVAHTAIHHFYREFKGSHAGITVGRVAGRGDVSAGW